MKKGFEDFTFKIFAKCYDGIAMKHHDLFFLESDNFRGKIVNLRVGMYNLND